MSMPITWAQVRAGLDPGRFTVLTVPGLLAKSKAWEGYEDAARPIVRAVELLAKGTKATKSGNGTGGKSAEGRKRRAASRGNHSSRL